ncbi:MAG: hypothetical protein IKM15_02570 [Peptococcaceae bacterium]|nr:hypothetical protein [Peptococcaceae bacterium]
MYHIGEKVVYGSEGACLIEAIEERDYGQECKEYYKLIPIYHQQSTIYVPVQNEQKVRLRKLMSKTFFEEIIEQTLTTPTTWIDDNKRRQQQTLETLKSGDIAMILVLIKNMLSHQQEKMLNSRDKEMLQKAQRLVFSEMAAVYEQAYDEIADEINSKLKAAIKEERLVAEGNIG